MRLRYVCFLVSVLLCALQTAVGQPVATAPTTQQGGVETTFETVLVPVLSAAPCTGQIAIDGQVDEECWQTAGPARAFKLERDASMDPRYPTTLKALYDDHSLYLSFVCGEPDPENVTVSVKQRDGGVWKDDCVEVFIDPAGEGRTYYQFVVNPDNVQEDGRFEFSIGKPTVFYTVSGPVKVFDGTVTADGTWNCQWQSATALGRDYWSAEIAIPFEAIGVTPAAGKLIRVNFTRNRVALGERLRRTSQPEYSVWSDPKCDIHTPGRFGMLLLAPDGQSAAKALKEVAVRSPALGLPGTPGVPPDLAKIDRVRFQVSTDQAGTPLPRCWDGMSASMQPELVERTYAKGYMTHIRMSSGTGRGGGSRDSQPSSDFARTDAAFDMLKEYNVRPVICLRGGPGGIEYSTTMSSSFGRVTGPPKKDEDYEHLYQAQKTFFQHLLSRYGKEFFDSIRFEYMNEPNASDRFFAGTVQDYCRMYDWVAKALKETSPTGKIGGPAVSGDGQDFTRSFLIHCREGNNAATGGQGAPLDFISFHVYGWRSRLCPAGSVQAINTLVGFWKLIHDERMGGREVCVTEWGVEHTGDATGPYYWFRKTQYAPVWMAKFVKNIDDAKAIYADLQPRMDALDLCLIGLTERPPFVGTRSIFIDKWVPKPYYNGYVLLNELGGERLKVAGDGGGRVECLATRRNDGSLAVLVFHFVEYAKESPPDQDVTVELAGLPLEGKKISQMRVDNRTSNSYTAWVAMGSPSEITDEAAEKLTAAAEVKKTDLPVSEGVVRLTMPVNSVAVVLVAPAGDP